ncbi:alpha-hydroxy-acid oxidizing protein [Isachenkonia alkalipeptolytica]|uniref:L-lactate oxidase n=1 Tax=Isachenkonia alkalipeptolytica TaxID=2565777 RepID=A0AA43XKU2_9CLOT|nr:alpha-hydroxy-acid oxidizing protein [Isachenkonia alkalipeptolytica]NBG88477.1 alpha-hydroxy-acid oxidizing protein [Isachenkonia alkalipeptolytica]
MNFLEMERKARVNLKGYCRVCPECDGYACAGEVPGMGGAGTAAAFKNNVKDLKNVRLKLKTIHSAKDPRIESSFFGNKVSFPILVAPVTGSAFNMGGALREEEYIKSAVQGSENAGTLAMIGDSADLTMYDEGLRALKQVRGKGAAIIKPRVNQDIIENIKKAEKIGLSAVGVDIDGAGLITMALKGQPVGPKTVEELKAIVKATELPVVLKGIMTPEEADLAVEIGAKAIVVSNHGGRVLDHAESTPRVLPEIAERVRGKIIILADGGIRSGVDAFKMIALGADGVLVGRPIVIGAFGGFEEGVTMVLEKMKQEFYQSMILTGASDLKDINRDKITVL